MDFKLRVNRKQIASAKSPDRNQQFLYIGQQRERFTALGLPLISVDAKYDRQPMQVKHHDFRAEADGLVTPYGIYDMRANRSSVFVGASHDTPTFAVDGIVQWRLHEGRRQYSAAPELFILADGGGSNGSRCRAWKKALQDNLCTPHRITVSHYPPGASKWNPIEHRLFSHISNNRAGEPLTTIEKPSSSSAPPRRNPASS
jgi:hypothetical protein